MSFADCNNIIAQIAAVVKEVMIIILSLLYKKRHYFSQYPLKKMIVIDMRSKL